MHGSLMFFERDLPDSAFGWAIAIPVLLLVGVILTAVLAVAALVTVVNFCSDSRRTCLGARADPVCHFPGDTGVGGLWLGEAHAAAAWRA